MELLEVFTNLEEYKLCKVFRLMGINQAGI